MGQEKWIFYWHLLQVFDLYLNNSLNDLLYKKELPKEIIKSDSKEEKPFGLL